MGSRKLPDDDLTMWNDFRNGDADAFAGLMHKYYKDLFIYATRFTEDTNEVKDCLQELFLSLWKHRFNLREAPQVRFYLLTSLRRLLIRSRNDCKNFSIYNEAYVRETLPGSSPPLEYLIIEENEMKQLAYKMKKVLSALSKREQEVIYLKFYEGADVDEISDIMSLHRQSVYNLLHDALKKLKKAIPSRSVFFSDITPLLNSLLFF